MTGDPRPPGPHPGRGAGPGRLAGLVAVCHPLPSAINAVLAAGLALIAGGGVAVALALAAGMAGFQASIGSLNDLVDAAADRTVKPRKPIPAGLVSRRAAWVVVIAAGLLGLSVSAAFGPAVLLLGVAGYGTGVAYDLVLRSRDLGWVAYAAAFPLALSWAWVAASGSLPPGWPLSLPVAALAGPAMHLANSLVDADGDRQAGRTSLAVRLGPRRAWGLLLAVEVAVYGLAWATLLAVGVAATGVIVAAFAATLAAGLGVALSRSAGSRGLEMGWLLQATGLALMALTWLAAVASA